MSMNIDISEDELELIIECLETDIKTPRPHEMDNPMYIARTEWVRAIIHRLKL